MSTRRFHSTAIAVLVTLAVFCWTPTLAQDEVPAATSSIVGKITDAATKTGVANATIVAYHLQTAKTFRSPPTTSKGQFEITGLEHGYYDLAVETPGGLFIGNQVVNVPPGGKAVARLQLTVGSEVPGARGDFPGSDEPPSGVAQRVKKSNTKMVAILTGAGAAAAIGLSGGSSSGSVQSPSAPPN